MVKHGQLDWVHGLTWTLTCSPWSGHQKPSRPWFLMVWAFIRVWILMVVHGYPWSTIKYHAVHGHSWSPFRRGSSWVECSHHPQIPAHRGLQQETDVWLQGGFQHHTPAFAKGVWGHLPDLPGWAAEVSKHPTRMVWEGSALWPEVELLPCCGKSRWKTCGHKMSQAVRVQILPLQGFLLSGVVSSFGCWRQVSMGRCGE